MCMTHLVWNLIGAEVCVCVCVCVYGEEQYF